MTRNANHLKYLTLAGVENAFANNGYAVKFRMAMWDHTSDTGQQVYRITYRNEDDDSIEEAHVYVWMGDDGHPRAEF